MKGERAIATYRRLREQALWRLLAADNGPIVLGLLETHLLEDVRSLPASVLYERLDRSLNELRAQGHHLPQSPQLYVADWLAAGYLERRFPPGRSKMLLPDAVRALLTRRYRARRCAWLAGEGNWPTAIALGCPSEQEAQRQPEAVRAWAEAWRGVGEVVWSERHWRSLGTQSLPERLMLGGAGDVAKWIGESQSWQRAHERYHRLGARWPRIARYFEVLADYAERDIERLEALLDWLDRNPNSNLYPRQLPIAGLDTKWLEPRMSLIADVRGGAESGLRPLPYLVRCCILDEALRRHVGALGDISARFDELAAIDLPASRIYIVENLQTGLAFGDEPGAVVFMGLGYGVGLLARLPWVARAPCIYWGDLDTHGFAILDRARASLPQLQSVLMDEETLLAFRDMWAQEREQTTAGVLPMLTPAEQEVYRGLKEQRWGVNVRLEQERIPWNFAAPRLRRL